MSCRGNPEGLGVLLGLPLCFDLLWRSVRNLFPMSIPSPHFGTAYRLIMPVQGVYDPSIDMRRCQYSVYKEMDSVIQQNSEYNPNELNTPIRYFSDHTNRAISHEAIAVFTNRHCQSLNPIFDDGKCITKERLELLYPSQPKLKLLEPHLNAIEPKNTFIIQTLDHLRTFCIHYLLPDLKAKA
jgi:hypothetical protein